VVTNLESTSSRRSFAVGTRPHLEPNGKTVAACTDTFLLPDDVLSYLGPSLQRHVGCDIVDIYPGAGLWSTKIHEVLRPRTHILMEPDDVYRPFLQPLALKPNVQLVPKSGIVWANLTDILTPTYLPHQVERTLDSTAATPQRNDSLLITANLSFFPKKRFGTFESVAALVLYQVISCIRASSLFQKYGLVRMLFWVGDDDKHAIVGRSCQRRRRMAIQSELSTEWIMEIAGKDVDDRSASYVREHSIDLASARRVSSLMRAAGTSIPTGRESRLLSSLLKVDKVDTNKRQPNFIRPYLLELEDLEKSFAGGGLDRGTDKYRRLLQLRYRLSLDGRQGDVTQELIGERNAIAAAYASRMVSEDMLRREAEWNDRITALPKALRAEFALSRDNAHLLYQDPPVMSWDRRELEPLVVGDTEFYPNAPCCLLDIQPKAMHPLMRSMGPRSDRAGDIFEFILRGMLMSSVDPVSKAIETVWPGAADGVLPHCPSLRDLHRGGSPVGGCGELTARTLNEAQLVEILEAWMRWPFRPSYPQLVSRMSDEVPVSDAYDEDEGSLD